MDKNLFKHIMEAEYNGYSSSHYDIYNDLYVTNTESLTKQASKSIEKKLLGAGALAAGVGGGMKYSYDKGFNKAGEIAAAFNPGGKVSTLNIDNIVDGQQNRLALGKRLYGDIPEIPETLKNTLFY